jgi:hypothetical protein
MEKTKFKIGDIVFWQELQGEVIKIDSDSRYPIRVRFTNNIVLNFTNNGRYYEATPQVLSHTPYTLNGFTQNEVIEKDTLVWVRDANHCNWHQRFYSHCINGKYYCFLDQKTSKETEAFESWVYLETNNPLIK